MITGIVVIAVGAAGSSMVDTVVIVGGRASRHGTRGEGSRWRATWRGSTGMSTRWLLQCVLVWGLCVCRTKDGTNPVYVRKKQTIP